MEFEVTIKLKIDTNSFYPDTTAEQFKLIVEEEIYNCIYDLDEYKVITIEAEEI